MTGREGIDLKFERARKLLLELNEEIRAHLEGGAFTAENVDRADGGVDTIVHIVKPAPASWSALMGDAIHNTRTALDHLAFALVSAAGGDTDNAYFPITDEEGGWGRRARAALPGVSPEIRAQVRALKPWRNGHPSLYLLHQLDIGDKHHLIIATAGSSPGVLTDVIAPLRASLEQRTGVKVPPQWIHLNSASSGTPIHEGDVVMSYPPDVRNQPEIIDMHMPTVAIVFGTDELVAGEHIIPVLGGILDSTQVAVEPLVQLLDTPSKSD